MQPQEVMRSKAASRSGFVGRRAVSASPRGRWTRAGACEVPAGSWLAWRQATRLQVVAGTHPGRRPNAATRSSAHGQPAAMRKVVRRAERTRTPALCSSV